MSHFFAYKKICFMLLLLCALISNAGCSSEKEPEGADIDASWQGAVEPILNETIGMPEEAVSDRAINLWVVTSYDVPVVVSMLKEEQEKKVEYHVSILQEDGTWHTEIPKWNEDCVGIKDHYIVYVTGSTDGYLYALLFDRDLLSQKVVRLGEDGSVRELDLSSVRKQYENKMLSMIALAGSSKLVLQFIDPDQVFGSGDEGAEGEEGAGDDVEAVEYDIVNEVPLDARGEMKSEQQNFDENGIYYMPNLEQELIVGRKIDSKLNECAIKCEGTIPMGPIDIKDDRGYIATPGGIYGGKLESGEWECLIPTEDMDLEDSNISPYALIKGANSDREFFCLLKSYDSTRKSQYQWIHYYE